MSSWWATDERLMSDWWATDEQLMSNWWATDERLMSDWWVTDERLINDNLLMIRGFWSRTHYIWTTLVVKSLSQLKIQWNWNMKLNFKIINRSVVLDTLPQEQLRNNCKTSSKIHCETNLLYWFFHGVYTSHKGLNTVYVLHITSSQYISMFYSVMWQEH